MDGGDSRGWFLSCASGVACVVGAHFVFLDLIVQRCQGPRARPFRIQDSDVFLASSLSLSFGVMIFSALSSLLPSARDYIQQAGASELWVLASFVLGYFGIQLVSRLLHNLLPSHVVSCDHSHTPSPAYDHKRRDHGHTHTRGRQDSVRIGEEEGEGEEEEASRKPLDEETPLLSSSPQPYRAISDPEVLQTTSSPEDPLPTAAPRPNLRTQTTPLPSHVPVVRDTVITPIGKKVLSFVKDTKSDCVESGLCYGFSDPCSQECTKRILERSSAHRHPSRPLPLGVQPVPTHRHPHGHLHHHNHHHHDHPPRHRSTRSQPHHHHHHHHHRPPPSSPSPTPSDEFYTSTSTCSPTATPDPEAQHEAPDADSPPTLHHHHVQTNSFLSIGLQTSIAIALHKFPEGFITYASNHANPELGFHVFAALFLHNFTEGFSMALPLYLALGSRVKAVVWSSLLGGLSQPLGAAMAAAWFHWARLPDVGPSAVVVGVDKAAGGSVDEAVGGSSLSTAMYACMFAATAGIMVSVALQLFAESLVLAHRQNLSIGCGFLGMLLLGVCNAFLGSE